jgi:two-component system, cell cycle sensor histidine kinase and response regulator CckA
MERSSDDNPSRQHRTVSAMRSQLPTVLVIDDEELVLEHIVTTLNRLGFPAVGQTTADGAIDALKSLPSLRVLLCEVCLKSGNGPELVRRLLRDWPQLKIVFMSGGFEDVPFRRTDPLVDKPPDVQRLRQAIDDVLNPSRSGFERRKILDRRRHI